MEVRQHFLKIFYNTNKDVLMAWAQNTVDKRYLGLMESKVFSFYKNLIISEESSRCNIEL